MFNLFWSILVSSPKNKKILNMKQIMMFQCLFCLVSHQVRFSIFRDCLPLADNKTRDVLRDNFSLKGKFDCQLSANQVYNSTRKFG